MPMQATAKAMKTTKNTGPGIYRSIATGQMCILSDKLL
jgi:hypothetical protein